MTSTNERYWLAGGGRPHRAISKAGFAFVKVHSRLLDLDVFFQRSGLERAKSIPGLSDAIDASDKNDVKKFFDEFRQHRNLMSELALCRVVDSFLQYLSNLLALIYETKPEMLKSSEKETLEFILSYSNMDELRAAIAEKRIEKISYLGLRDLAKHLEDHMGFSLFPNSDVLEEVSLLVEYRNVFVHAGGVVGSTSARRSPSLAARVGERLQYAYTDFRPHRQVIENSMFEIDERAIDKFGLASTPIPDPPPELA